MPCCRRDRPDVGTVLSIRLARDVRRVYGIREISPLVLFLGQINADKGIANIIDAANRVWREVSDAYSRVSALLGPTTRPPKGRETRRKIHD